MPKPARSSTLSIRTAVLAAIVAAFGVLALLFPPLQDIAENADLSWLFGARGAREAPPGVVVISIDKESARELNLPNEPHRWPRRLHAQLLDRLSAAGARVIGFDVMFKQPQNPQDDALLADSIARAGNVVLFSYLDVRNIGAEARVEHVVSPLPALMAKAQAAAIFPLPKFPKRVNQFWTFKPSAGAMPTFPVVMAQLAAHDDYVALRASPMLSAFPLPATVRDAVREPGLAETMTRMRSLLRRASAREIVDGARSLHTIYTAPDSAYLNFYGPARTVTTIPFHRALRDEQRENYAGKAVFIGLSEPLQTDQLDTFHTVFSQPDGVDLSGVEISATAYANLRAQEWITPLSGGAMMVLAVLWAFAVTLLCAAMPAPAAVGGAVVLGAGYFGFSLLLFSQANLWLPQFVPLAVEAPIALFAITLSRYFEESREKRKVRDALQRYLPATVIDEIADDIAQRRQTQHLVYGACIATDAEHYTTLSEKMSPQVLGQFMNRYYGALFPPVRKHGGFVSDVVGDAMMAIWASLNAPDAKRRKSACLAALEMSSAAEEFNRSQPLPLPTRIGVHAGEMALGNVGTDDHYEYRAVGDMVNTASRVQGLNKLLRTRVLATGDAVRDVDGIAMRRIGAFRLAGKRQPVEIFELFSVTNESARESIASFERAQALFMARAWAEAEAEFKALCERNPNDGPAEYFARLCRAYRAHPPAAAWEGVIDVDAK